MRRLATAPESLFWYWITERHRIYVRRFEQKQPKPWTDDPILRHYKFTNPFRENDRGTVWLRKKFLEPHRNDDLRLLAANICWYRMFNWIGTGEALGWRTSWDTEIIKNRLESIQGAGGQVFTGAHIVYSPPGLGKVEAITKVCEDLWNLCHTHIGFIQQHNTLQNTFELLKTVHCVGGFMAYEMVSDMRHTPLLENATDIMTWANPGPGAVRGMRRLQLTPNVESMRQLLARSREALPSDIPSLEMRDIEHSLCEFDKYCRVKFDEGEPRSRFNG